MFVLQFQRQIEYDAGIVEAFCKEFRNFAVDCA
jgi:hypothetical protein